MVYLQNLRIAAHSSASMFRTLQKEIASHLTKCNLQQNYGQLSLLSQWKARMTRFSRKEKRSS